MNPYQSPLNISDKPSAEFHWRRWLLIGVGLFLAAGIVLPAFTPAKHSRCYASHSTVSQRLSQELASGCVESAKGVSPAQVTVNP